ncbi:MAG: class I SAM-dependent methyltransferase [Deinococcus sp.]
MIASTPARPPDSRLAAALALIRAEVHADIGSDHAALPVALLRSGRVGRCIVVEKKAAPLEVARGTLERARLLDRAELRLGDGFAPLLAGEVESASLTGMGGRTLLGILERGAARLPQRLVLQPNDSAAGLRGWARRQGYWLTHEELVPGFWRYPLLAEELKSQLRRLAPLERHGRAGVDAGLAAVREGLAWLEGEAAP